MLTTLYAKLAGLALILAALGGLYLWGHHEGASGVQARWDAAKVLQSAAADRQAAASASQTLDWTQQFQSVATHYEVAAHETLPAVADAVGPAVTAGTLRLRDDAPAVCRGQLPVAAARSRAADAAATQALADRLANSIAAVRAGDAADARERALSQQVIALQALLEAERQQSPAR